MYKRMMVVTCSIQHRHMLLYIASCDNVLGSQRLHWATPDQRRLLHLLRHPPGDSHLRGRLQQPLRLTCSSIVGKLLGTEFKLLRLHRIMLYTPGSFSLSGHKFCNGTCIETSSKRTFSLKVLYMWGGCWGLSSPRPDCHLPPGPSSECLSTVTFSCTSPINYTLSQSKLNGMMQMHTHTHENNNRWTTCWV